MGLAQLLGRGVNKYRQIKKDSLFFGPQGGGYGRTFLLESQRNGKPNQERQDQ
jgi:hypothetical protein